MRATRGAGEFGAHRGDLKLVKALVAHNVDLFAENRHALTALGHAVPAADASKREVNGEIIVFVKGNGWSRGAA